MDTKTIVVPDEADAIYEAFYEKGWTDGLPVIPPTRERVAAMAATVDKGMDEVVCILPPGMTEATIEKLAINAVMAGCLPSYFPVVVAATEAIADPAFNCGGHQTTTSPTAVMLVINGPIRNEIGVNCDWGCFSPGHRANATIGRAINLILTNVGLRLPGEVTKTVLGNPCRYSMCIGEREEASPWEPLHVDLGFKQEDSTVTIVASNGFHSLEDFESTTAQPLLESLTGGVKLSLMHSTYPMWGLSEIVLVFCPAYATILSREGYSKKDVQQHFFEHTQDLPLSLFSEYMFKCMIAMDTGEYKFWYDRDVMAERGLFKKGQRQITSKGVALAARPEQFVIIVAGGDGGINGNLIPQWADSHIVTRLIERKKG